MVQAPAEAPRDEHLRPAGPGAGRMLDVAVTLVVTVLATAGAVAPFLAVVFFMFAIFLLGFGIFGIVAMGCAALVAGVTASGVSDAVFDDGSRTRRDRVLRQLAVPALVLAVMLELPWMLYWASGGGWTSPLLLSELALPVAAVGLPLLATWRARRERSRPVSTGPLDGGDVEAAGTEPSGRPWLRRPRNVAVVSAAVVVIAVVGGFSLAPRLICTGTHRAAFNEFPHYGDIQLEPAADSIFDSLMGVGWSGCVATYTSVANHEAIEDYYRERLAEHGWDVAPAEGPYWGWEPGVLEHHGLLEDVAAALGERPEYVDGIGVPAWDEQLAEAGLDLELLGEIAHWQARDPSVLAYKGGIAYYVHLWPWDVTEDGMTPVTINVRDDW
jgi:hypothetical protein